MTDAKYTISAWVLDKLVKEVDDGDTGDKSDKHLEAQDCNIQYLLC